MCSHGVCITLLYHLSPSAEHEQQALEAAMLFEKQLDAGGCAPTVQFRQFYEQLYGEAHHLSNMSRRRSPLQGLAGSRSHSLALCVSALYPLPAAPSLPTFSSRHMCRSCSTRTCSEHTYLASQLHEVAEPGVLLAWAHPYFSGCF